MPRPLLPRGVNVDEPTEGVWADALTHPVRVALLKRLLVAGTTTPSDFARAVSRSNAAVAFHFQFLLGHGIIRLTGTTRRRGQTTRHYTLVAPQRTAAALWGLRARLLVTDLERQMGAGDATVLLDAQGMADMQELTASYLARLGELGLRARERRSASERESGRLTKVGVLLATDDGVEPIEPGWK